MSIRFASTSSPSLNKILNPAALASRPVTSPSKLDSKEIVRLESEGKTASEIAELVGSTESYLKSLGIGLWKIGK